jgi:glycosyltransferase involved in cell wall biosynthesis
VNKGYGAALKTGILHADGEWILIIDADGSYSPKDIPKLLEHIQDYDMVVGARTGEAIKKEKLRNFAKFIMTGIANYLTGVKIPDLNSGLRIFKKEPAMKFFKLLPNKFSFTTTITLAFLSDGYNVKYVPITYHKRTGESKIKPRMFLNFVLLIIRTVTYFNPLKIFLPASIFLLLVSFGLYFYSLALYNFYGIMIELKYIIIVLFLASMQIGFFGLLADMITKREIR